MQDKISFQPVITEKSLKRAENKEYTFLVDPSSSKYLIKRAIEAAFAVSVKEVRTKTSLGKTKKRGRFNYQTQDKKIAIVRVGEKDKIDLFETEEKKKRKKKL